MPRLSIVRLWPLRQVSQLSTAVMTFPIAFILCFVAGSAGAAANYAGWIMLFVNLAFSGGGGSSTTAVLANQREMMLALTEIQTGLIGISKSVYELHNKIDDLPEEDRLFDDLKDTNEILKRYELWLREIEINSTNGLPFIEDHYLEKLDAIYADLLDNRASLFLYLDTRPVEVTHALVATSAATVAISTILLEPSLYRAQLEAGGFTVQPATQDYSISVGEHISSITTYHEAFVELAPDFAKGPLYEEAARYNKLSCWALAENYLNSSPVCPAPSKVFDIRNLENIDESEIVQEYSFQTCSYVRFYEVDCPGGAISCDTYDVENQIRRYRFTRSMNYGGEFTNRLGDVREEDWRKEVISRADFDAFSESAGRPREEQCIAYTKESIEVIDPAEADADYLNTEAKHSDIAVTIDQGWASDGTDRALRMQQSAQASLRALLAYKIALIQRDSLGEYLEGLK